jgi:hypothetical protein
MAIAGHVSRAMLEKYSHIRMAAKRAALEAISTPLPELACEKAGDFRGAVHQIDNQIELDEKATAGKLLN